MTKQKYVLVIVLVFMQVFAAFSQKTVSGTILDGADNSPLDGVSVKVKNAKTGTQSNKAGYYSITAPVGTVILFSYVGYTNVEYVITEAESVHNVKMVEGSKNLSEVVVNTGYGIQKNKGQLNSMVNVVDGDDIAQTKRPNFINSLSGRVPGATITSTTGMPGASTSIILRAPTSIDGNNQPVFVVDGVIIDNTSFEMQDRLPATGGVSLANRSNDFLNRAADINPEDIENVTILKGPEATALYGSDGANGAIVITTKKGKKGGRANISYNANYRWEKVSLNRIPEMQTVYDQGTNGFNNPASRLFFGEKIPAGTPIFDNIGGFFRVGKSQIHNLAIDGGGDIGTYRFSASYNNQEGIVENTGFERFNFRLASTMKLAPKVNLTSTVNYINTRVDKASKGSGGFLLSMLTWPVDDDMSKYLNADGTRRGFASNLAGTAEDDNPYWDVNKNKNNDLTDRISGSVNLAYDPAKWLNISILHGIDLYNTKSTWFLHPLSNLSRTTLGSLIQWSEKQRLLNGVYRATARKKFGRVNNVLTGAFTFDSRKYEINSIKGERFFEPEFISINNTDPLTVASITTFANWNRAGAFLTYNGTYNNWLNISGSYRVDFSSRLVNPAKYNINDATYGYYSVGANVVLTEAFKNLPSFITYAKARVNYATTGRDPSSPYVKGNKFTASTFSGGGFTPFVTQGNPNLTAELSKQFETGMELKFFKNRLGIDFAYYENKTIGQLFNPRISYASGSILQWLNGGTVRNRGIEAQITGNPVKGKNFNWDITVNFARNRNKIIEMPAGLPQFYNSDTWITNLRNIAVKGGNIYQMASNRYARNNKGDIIIGNAGLPIIVADYTPIADRQPDFTGGIVNSLNYKNITLSFNLDIKVGGDVYNGTAEFMYRNGSSIRTLDRETPRIIKGVLNDGLENTTNPTPNNIVVTPYFKTDFYSNGALSENFIERDINWLRLRDVSLTYKLPSKLIKKQKVIKGASFTITGTDLFILSNYSGADPSVNANNGSTRGGIGGIGMDFGNVPTPRGINLALSVNF
jgi:ferric enterobactin receptor